MNRRRVGEDRGSKETDGCPLTGSDWVTYKQHMTIALGACGLGEYVDRTVPIPLRFVTDSTGVVKDVEWKYKECRRSQRK
jgi:hypothetical protein